MNKNSMQKFAATTLFFCTVMLKNISLKAAQAERLQEVQSVTPLQATDHNKGVTRPRYFSSVKLSSYPGYKRGYGWRGEISPMLKFDFYNMDDSKQTAFSPALRNSALNASLGHSVFEKMNYLISLQGDLAYPMLPNKASRYSTNYGVLPSAAQLIVHGKYFHENFRMNGGVGFSVNNKSYSVEKNNTREYPLTWLRMSGAVDYSKIFHGFASLDFGLTNLRKIEVKNSCFPDLTYPRYSSQEEINSSLTIGPAHGMRVGVESWIFSIFKIHKPILENTSIFGTFKTQSTTEKNIFTGRYGFEKGIRLKFAPFLGLDLGWDSLLRKTDDFNEIKIKSFAYKLLTGQFCIKLMFSWASNLSKNETFSFSSANVANLRRGSASRVDLYRDMKIDDLFMLVKEEEHREVETPVESSEMKDQLCAVLQQAFNQRKNNGLSAESSKDDANSIPAMYKDMDALNAQSPQGKKILDGTETKDLAQVVEVEQSNFFFCDKGTQDQKDEQLKDLKPFESQTDAEVLSFEQPLNPIVTEDSSSFLNIRNFNSSGEDEARQEDEQPDFKTPVIIEKKSHVNHKKAGKDVLFNKERESSLGDGEIRENSPVKERLIKTEASVRNKGRSFQHKTERKKSTFLKK